MKVMWGLLSAFLLLAAGCGGGGGGTSATGTYVHFAVSWGQRGRSMDGPGSALSMMLRIADAGVPNGDFVYAIDRDTAPAAHTSEYVSTNQVKPGSHLVTATFYAGSGGTGDVVGVASGSMTVSGDGTLSGTILTAGTVAAVEVPAGQAVGVGQTLQLSFGAKDSTGGLVAVTPGSAIWSVVSGPDKLTFENAYVKGLVVGAAGVTATVDGKTSAPAVVNVTSGAVVTISIDPTTATVVPGGSKRFTATVTGSSNTAVTWTVLTQSGGSVDQTGLYIAPGTVMYSTVEARSEADPTKAATAVVTVQNAVLSVHVTPSPATVATNGTRQFAATVEGSPNQVVNWSVVPGTTGGSISSGGLYQAPSNAGSCTVRATSQAVPQTVGSAAVTVTGPVVGKIAYDAADKQIYTINTDGTGKTKLTSTLHYFMEPAWSPDGTQLACQGAVNGFTGPGLFTMDADGSHLTQRTFGLTNSDNNPSWSPDGTRLAYGSNGLVRNRIYTQIVGETTYSFITASGAVESPVWSPDGTKFAFVAEIDGTHSIWRIGADGLGETQLTFATRGPEWDPAWSPDGQKIAFWSEDSVDGTQIYVMDANGSNHVKLTSSGFNKYPSWSPDGNRIVFCNSTTSGGTSTLWVMNADGTGKEHVSTGTNGSEFRPAWRPQ